MNRFEELLAGYLEGTLTANEVHELAGLIDCHPENRFLFVDLVQQHQLLQVECRPQDDHEFAATVLATLKEDERMFIAGIMGDVRQEHRPREREPAGWLASFKHLTVCVLNHLRQRPVLALSLLFALALALFLGQTFFRAANQTPEIIVLKATSQDVTFFRDGQFNPAPALGEMVFFPKSRVQTGPRGTATLSFGSDQAVVELGADSVAEILTPRRGRGLVLHKGNLHAKVDKQSSGTPLRVLTSVGEYTVRGTEFKLIAAKGETRLDVMKGVVSFRRSGSFRAIEVSTGHFLISGKRGMQTPAAAELITVNFGPDGTELPDNIINDSGRSYDSRLRYGWDGPAESGHLPGEYWAEPNGNLVLARRGRTTALRSARRDLLFDSLISTGWRNHSQTWRFQLANGRYQVTLTVGDSEYEQGPHHITVEDRLIVNSVLTAKGEFVTCETAIEITDGELTVVVGGYDGPSLTQDGSFDTTLNFIQIKNLNPHEK